MLEGKSGKGNVAIQLLPGVLLCVLLMFSGKYLAEILSYLMIELGILSANSGTPISGIFVTILLGVLLRNLIGVKDIFLQGISFSLKYILRIGIVLLGL